MDHVNTRHADYNELAERWRKCRDFSDGQAKVRKAGERYLRKNGAEDQAAYDARLSRSDLYNATWATLKTLRGMMFRKEPTTDLPSVVDRYLADIDAAGTNLKTFVREVALEVLEVGRVGILVDHPPLTEASPISMAVAEQMGLRPTMQLYEAEAIINWSTRRIGNRTVLGMVVLEEEVEVAESEFKTKCVKQWRVLDLDEAGFYRQRLFRKREGNAGAGEFEQIGDDVYPLLANAKMTEVPFFILGTDGLDIDPDEPPLIDLVDTNEAHYQVNSDLRATLHFGVPTFCISGYVTDDNETITVGSRTALVFPDAQAKAYFAEPTGPMVPEMRNALADFERRMAMLGARMLMQEKAAAEAAQTASIKRQGEDASLADIAQAISDAMERALTVFCRWAGVDVTVAYQLNRDFNPAGLSPQELTALLSAVQAGELSSQSFFDLLQRADVVSPELTYEDEQERIGQGGPVAPVQPQPGAVAA